MGGGSGGGQRGPGGPCSVSAAPQDPADHVSGPQRAAAAAPANASMSSRSLPLLVYRSSRASRLGLPVFMIAGQCACSSVWAPHESCAACPAPMQPPGTVHAASIGQHITMSGWRPLQVGSSAVRNAARSLPGSRHLWRASQQLVTSFQCADPAPRSARPSAAHQARHRRPPAVPVGLPAPPQPASHLVQLRQCHARHYNLLQVDDGSEVPAGRGGAACTAIDGQRILCFGGATREALAFDDWWLLELGADGHGHWTRVSPVLKLSHK